MIPVEYMMQARGGGKSWAMRRVLERSLADGITMTLCTTEGTYRVRRVRHAPFVLDLYERLEQPWWRVDSAQ